MNRRQFLTTIAVAPLLALVSKQRPMPQFTSGGVYKHAQMVIVGESGPETFVFIEPKKG